MPRTLRRLAHRAAAYTLLDRLFRLRTLFRPSARPLPHRLGFDRLEDRTMPDGRPLPFPVIYAGTGEAALAGRTSAAGRPDDLAS